MDGLDLRVLAVVAAIAFDELIAFVFPSAMFEHRDQIVSALKYPIAIYPEFIRFILPFGLFVSLPIDTLLYGAYNPYLLSLAIVGAAIGFFALATFVWTRCEKRYESTGS